MPVVLVPDDQLIQPPVIGETDLPNPGTRRNIREEIIITPQGNVVPIVQANDIDQIVDEQGQENPPLPPVQNYNGPTGPTKVNYEWLDQVLTQKHPLSNYADFDPSTVDGLDQQIIGLTPEMRDELRRTYGENVPVMMAHRLLRASEGQLNVTRQLEVLESGYIRQLDSFDVLGQENIDNLHQTLLLSRQMMEQTKVDVPLFNAYLDRPDMFLSWLRNNFFVLDQGQRAQHTESINQLVHALDIIEKRMQEVGSVNSNEEANLTDYYNKLRDKLRNLTRMGEEESNREELINEIMQEFNSYRASVKDRDLMRQLSDIRITNVQQVKDLLDRLNRAKLYLLANMEVAGEPTLTEDERNKLDERFKDGSGLDFELALTARKVLSTWMIEFTRSLGELGGDDDFTKSFREIMDKHKTFDTSNLRKYLFDLSFDLVKLFKTKNSELRTMESDLKSSEEIYDGLSELSHSLQERDYNSVQAALKKISRNSFNRTGTKFWEEHRIISNFLEKDDQYDTLEEEYQTLNSEIETLKLEHSHLIKVLTENRDKSNQEIKSLREENQELKENPPEVDTTRLAEIQQQLDNRHQRLQAFEQELARRREELNILRVNSTAGAYRQQLTEIFAAITAIMGTSGDSNELPEWGSEVGNSLITIAARMNAIRDMAVNAGNVINEGVALNQTLINQIRTLQEEQQRFINMIDEQERQIQQGVAENEDALGQIQNRDHQIAVLNRTLRAFVDELNESHRRFVDDVELAVTNGPNNDARYLSFRPFAVPYARARGAASSDISELYAAKLANDANLTVNEFTPNQLKRYILKKRALQAANSRSENEREMYFDYIASLQRNDPNAALTNEIQHVTQNYFPNIVALRGDNDYRQRVVAAIDLSPQAAIGIQSNLLMSMYLDIMETPEIMLDDPEMSQTAANLFSRQGFGMPSVMMALASNIVSNYHRINVMQGELPVQSLTRQVLNVMSMLTVAYNDLQNAVVTPEVLQQMRSYIASADFQNDVGIYLEEQRRHAETFTDANILENSFVRIPPEVIVDVESAIRSSYGQLGDNSNVEEILSLAWYTSVQDRLSLRSDRRFTRPTSFVDETIRQNVRNRFLPDAQMAEDVISVSSGSASSTGTVVNVRGRAVVVDNDQASVVPSIDLGASVASSIDLGRMSNVSSIDLGRTSNVSSINFDSSRFGDSVDLGASVAPSNVSSIDLGKSIASSIDLGKSMASSIDLGKISNVPSLNFDSSRFGSSVDLGKTIDPSTASYDFNDGLSKAPTASYDFNDGLTKAASSFDFNDGLSTYNHENWVQRVLDGMIRPRNQNPIQIESTQSLLDRLRNNRRSRYTHKAPNESKKRLHSETDAGEESYQTHQSTSVPSAPNAVTYGVEPVLPDQYHHQSYHAKMDQQSTGDAGSISSAESSISQPSKKKKK